MMVILALHDDEVGNQDVAAKMNFVSRFKARHGLGHTAHWLAGRGHKAQLRLRRRLSPSSYAHGRR
jgi:hypothetical protein